MLHLAALIGIVLLVPHTALKRSEPAADSRVATPPARVTLWFTGEPQLAFSRIRLRGPAGDIALDTIVADTGHALHARIPIRLEPGAYRVIWQTASADGHPIRGEFAFTVVGAAAPPVPAADTAMPAAPDSSATPRAVEQVRSEFRTVRWLEFAALLAVLGALGFRHGVLPPLAIRGVPTSDAADRTRRVGLVALVVYAGAALTRLYTQAAALHGDSAMQFDAFAPTLSTTTWGIGWMAGVVGAVMVAVGWALPRRVASFLGTPLALTGALGMVLGPALSGHAVASRSFVPSVALDTMHVAAAGLWIGGVLMLLVVGIPAMRALPDGNRDMAVRALVSSFHPLALFCAPVVLFSGAATSWIRLGSLAALRTTYGSTLMLKLGLFACVAAMGAYNASRGRGRLGSPEGTRRFLRTGTIELALAALVLAATTILVVSPVPSEISE